MSQDIALLQKQVSGNFHWWPHWAWILGTVILILPEIHGSLVPGYAQFGINLLTAHTFGCVKV